jgi:hypothetical protein
MTYSLRRFDIDDELLLLQVLSRLSAVVRRGPKGTYLEGELHFAAAEEKGRKERGGKITDPRWEREKIEICGSSKR